MSIQVTQVKRGKIAEETEVQLQSDHRRQMRSQYRRGRCPVRSHRSGEVECRVGGPAPVVSQRTDEVTVKYTKVSSQFTRGQTRSECRVGGGPVPVGSHERTDEITVQKREVSSQVTRGQTRSECRGDGVPAPVGSRRTDETTVQKREVSSQVTQGQKRSQYSIGRCPVWSHRSDEVILQRRRRSSSSLITEVRWGHITEGVDVQSGHIGQARSDCREGGGPAPVGSQMTDQVTVQYKKVSSQVT